MRLFTICYFKDYNIDSRCIFIRNKTPQIPNFSLTHPFYKVQLEKNLVMNVLQNGVWGSYRHTRWNEGKHQLYFFLMLQISMHK